MGWVGSGSAAGGPAACLRPVSVGPLGALVAARWQPASTVCVCHSSVHQGAGGGVAVVLGWLMKGLADGCSGQVSAPPGAQGVQAARRPPPGKHLSPLLSSHPSPSWPNAGIPRLHGPFSRPLISSAGTSCRVYCGSRPRSSTSRMRRAAGSTLGANPPLSACRLRTSPWQ